MYNAVNQQVSYNDFVNASKQNQPIPVVNTIKFNEDGKFGDGSNDWSKNGGTNGENNNNTVIHNPHSTFHFFQPIFLQVGLNQATVHLLLLLSQIILMQ